MGVGNRRFVELDNPFKCIDNQTFEQNLGVLIAYYEHLKSPNRNTCRSEEKSDCKKYGPSDEMINLDQSNWHTQTQYNNQHIAAIQVG